MVAATVGIEVCRAFTGLHANTGCETVSAFSGKHKTSALKLFTSNKGTQDTFLQLRQEWDLSPELIDKVETFTQQLYGPQASTTKANELRCQKRLSKDCLTKYTSQLAGLHMEKMFGEGLSSHVGRGWKMGREEEAATELHRLHTLLKFILI